MATMKTIAVAMRYMRTVSYKNVELIFLEDLMNLDVDFEFFDPQPSVDFHGLKNLCRQLFGNDAQLFDLSALVDLILSQPTLGSTIKVDGNESDPYAFLSVINLKQHQV
jgi:protein BCP1